MTGYSILVTSGMTFDYPIVDLDRKSVTARVLHEGNVVMEVVFDFERDTMQKKGGIEEPAHATIVSGINRVGEDVYIRMLKRSAKFFVDNHISDPKQYLQEQRNNGEVD